MPGNQWDGERIPGLGWMLAAIAVGALFVWVVTAIYLFTGGAL